MNNVTRKRIALQNEHIEWVQENFGDDVSFSWLLGLLLDNFIQASVSTPRDIARIGAVETRKGLE